MSTLIIVIILLLICVAITLFFIISLYYSFLGMIHRRAPYVPVRKAVLPDIVDALELKPGSMLYDLGCGDARVLKSAIEAEPLARGVGIEINWLVVQMAKRKTKNLPIQIKRSDMYAEDLSSATHLFCYLFPSMLKKLEPQLQAQCRPGTRIVTCDFTFPNLVPEQTITLQAKKRQTCEKLYVYAL
jgi:hypothetical protein